MSKLTGGKRLLLRAKAEGRLLPAFNVYNLETMQAALVASANAGQPVILSFGAGYQAHASFPVIRAMAEALAREHTQDVVLHLDHCRDIAEIRQALDAGFPSLMYDGSRLPFADNVRFTREAVSLTQPYGVCMEGELGGLNDESGAPDGEMPAYTDPTQARRFAQETGIDILAVSIGNAHGLYRGEPLLQLERLAEINALAGVPLVLHGSTGIEMPMLRQAAACGVVKININTDIAMAGADAARAMLQTPEGQRLECVMLAARERMRGVMDGYFMR